MAVSAALLLALAGATRDVTPVEKVVSMLKDLQAQVEADGGAEAATYDTFACFCKSKTSEKTTSIEETGTSVDSLQADLSSYSSTRATLDMEVNALNADLTQYAADHTAASEMRANETRTFELAYSDMSTAIAALQRAIETLKASKTSDMDLLGVKADVQRAMITAAVLNIVTPHAKKVASLLKTQHHAGHHAKHHGKHAKSAHIDDPFAEDSPPTSDYTFRSGDIIGTLESLLSTFKEKKSTLDSEDAAAQSSFNLAAQAKKAQIKAAEESLATKQTAQSTAAENIAIAQADLTAKSALLNDDRLYLKDLTATCETKAKEWDQRAQTRTDELAAIAQAVGVLESTVAEEAQKTRLSLATAVVSEVQPALPDDEDAEDAEDEDDESFLQTGRALAGTDAADYVAFLQRKPKVHEHKSHQHKRHGAHAALAHAHAAKHHARAAQHAKHGHAALVRKMEAVVKSATKGTQTAQQAAEKVMRTKLVAILAKAGKALKSPTLAALATKVAEDPFSKVKEMIQSLITRLLEEEADEATHKGWCDTELAKTLKDRDYRTKDLAATHSQVESANARKGSLHEDKLQLTHQIGNLTADLTEQQDQRTNETAEHAQTVEDAKAGQDAVQQAIDTLSHFYGEAAQGQVEENAADAAVAKLLATSSRVRRQPADEAPDAGFSGAYTGSQSASTGILGLLDVIKGDFARSISETEASEAQAKREFVEFERETKVSIQTKETALESTTSELTAVELKISTDMSTLREQQGLLDTAVKTWTELLPQCVADPGMTAEERVQRREAEIEALKQAYCILNDEDADCHGVF